MSSNKDGHIQHSMQQSGIRRIDSGYSPKFTRPATHPRPRAARVLPGWSAVLAMTAISFTSSDVLAQSRVEQLSPGTPTGQPTTISLTGEPSVRFGLTNDYRFRGISRSFRDPAVQAGARFTLPANFYFDVFGSTVDKTVFTNSRGVELDVTAGYRHTFATDWTLDVGLVQYLFPTATEFSTLEAFVGASWNWISFKINNTLSNRHFGIPNAKYSQYFDLSGRYPLLPWLNLTGHYGIQRIDGNDGGFNDYKLGLHTNWKGFDWELAMVGTDVDETLANAAGRRVDLGGRGFVFTVGRRFAF